eukprot:snap_masked-scaffold_85-processed-gene-0.30-mRNA-1 protein AED:0.36 eAED:0.38 QI:0/-1/0/1/-1/1/1/0/564
MNSNKNKIILSNKKDYAVWRMRIEVKLRTKNLYNLKPLKTTTDKETGEKQTSGATPEQQAEALCIIYKYIDNNILRKLRNISTSGKALKEIEKIFAIDKRQERRRLEKVIRKVQGSNYQKKIYNFDCAVSDYEYYGGKMSEDQKIEAIMNVLTGDKVHHLRLTVELDPDKYSYFDIYNKYLQFAEDLDHSNAILKTKRSYTPNNPKRTKKPSKGICCHGCNGYGHFMSECPNVSCDYCKKSGHTERICKKKEREQANMAKNSDHEDVLSDSFSYKSDSESSESEYSANVASTFTANVSSTKPKVLLDSCVSLHVTSKKYIHFIQDIQEIPKFKLNGIGKGDFIVKKGDLTLYLPSGRPFQVKNVHILDSEKDILLLSLGTLMKQGLKFIAENENMFLHAKNIKQKIKIRVGSNNLFSLDLYLKDLIAFVNEEVLPYFNFHDFFGHPNLETLKSTMKFYQLPYKNDHKRQCKTCSEAKHTKAIVNKQREEKSTYPLERLYCDTFQPLVKGYKGQRGIVLVTNSFSKFKWTKIYNSIGSAANLLKNILKEILNISENRINVLYMDQ